jgi:hypothetical protein
VLHVGDTAIRVWIDSLPNLFLFFTDVDARPSEDETLKDFLTGDTLHKLLSDVSALADQVYEGFARITVENRAASEINCKNIRFSTNRKKRLLPPVLKEWNLHRRRFDDDHTGNKQLRCGPYQQSNEQF